MRQIETLEHFGWNWSDVDCQHDNAKETDKMASGKRSSKMAINLTGKGFDKMADKLASNHSSRRNGQSNRQNGGQGD